jgi:hypothetical protein
LRFCPWGRAELEAVLPRRSFFDPLIESKTALMNPTATFVVPFPFLSAFEDFVCNLDYIQHQE